MIKLLDILGEGIIQLTSDERNQIENMIPKIIDIIQGPQISSKEYKKVDWINYQFADKTPGKVFVWVGNDDPKAYGYFYTNDPNNPEDNSIVIQQNQFAKYFGVKSKIRKILTGTENQGIELLRKTLKHELIHAKDPALNHHYLKEPYDSNKEEGYYKSWAEFQTMTGQFLETIVSKVEELMKRDLSDKEIRNIEFALKNILDFFAGKEKSLYQPTVDFIQNTKGRNFFQNFLQNLEYSLAPIIGYQGDALSVYVYYINKIKQYNPKGYKEFLKDLYKTIDQAKDKINNTLNSMKKQNISEEFKRMQKLAGLITEEETEENITKKDVEQIKQEVFNKVTNSPEINQKVQELVDSLPKDAIISLAKNFSSISSVNEEKKLPVSAYSDIFSLILKRSDSLEEISQSELSIIFDKLSNNPEITKEEIEKLKLDTAEYLSELAENSNLVGPFLPLIGLAASFAARAAFNDVSWTIVFATAGISSVLYLIMNAVFGKSYTFANQPISDFEDYALDKLNKRRALQGKKPIKITKPETKDALYNMGYVYPELMEKIKKWEEVNKFKEKDEDTNFFKDFTGTKQGKLFFDALEKKYPGIIKYGYGALSSLSAYAAKWKDYPDIRFKPTPIDQVVNKNVDVEQEYQKLLKQNGLKDILS